MLMWQNFGDNIHVRVLMWQVEIQVYASTWAYCGDFFTCINIITTWCVTLCWYQSHENWQYKYRKGVQKSVCPALMEPCSNHTKTCCKQNFFVAQGGLGFILQKLITYHQKQSHGARSDLMDRNWATETQHLKHKQWNAQMTRMHPNIP